MTAGLLIDCQAIHGAFRQWQADQEPVAAQLSESLAALAAYQSHLDAWQQQLVGEREELATIREQFDADRAAAAKNQEHSLAEATAELNVVREKVSTLTTALLSRTEELRTLDNRRAELVTELELARVREKELTAALEEVKQTCELDRAQWSDELQHTQELLQRHLEKAALAHHESATEEIQVIRPPQSANPHPLDQNLGSTSEMAETPVLGSILQQFGKLRQQRALDRPSLKKAR